MTEPQESLDNMLTREPVGRMIDHLRYGKEPMPMYVTYDDLFTFVIMLCAIITLVFHHKK